MFELRNYINLRKINSLLIIVIIFMLLWHGLLSVLYLYGLSEYSPNFQITGRRLFIVLSLHVIISIYLFLKSKIKTRNVNKYYKLNKDTSVQMITGIFIAVFVILHVLGYSKIPINLTDGFRLSNYLTDNLLFLSIILHLRVSVPRLLITFGFLEDKNSYDMFKRKNSIILAIIFLCLISAEIIFYMV